VAERFLEDLDVVALTCSLFSKRWFVISNFGQITSTTSIKFLNFCVIEKMFLNYAPSIKEVVRTHVPNNWQ